MKKILSFVLALVLVIGIGSVAAFAEGDGYMVVTDYIVCNTGKDISDELQQLIEENPNRTLFFPDGEYLVSKPIYTPADPKKSVSLKMANYAIIKATGDWKYGEAVIQLGGIYPKNDTRTPGSNYYLDGGIIDGSGKANGVSINGGRETMVKNVSMKNVVTGLHIMYGANSGSSDSDILDLNIICTGGTDSVGILIEGYDNTVTNVRIGNAFVGVLVKSAGNVMRNIHPLYTSDYTDYANSCGFWDQCGNNWYDYCYSDQYGIAFRLKGGVKSIFNDCYCYWYSTKGDSHTAFKVDGQFQSTVTNFKADLPDCKGNNLLVVDKSGGKGRFTNLSVNNKRIENRLYKAYVADSGIINRLPRIFYKIAVFFVTLFN